VVPYHGRVRGEFAIALPESLLQLREQGQGVVAQHLLADAPGVLLRANAPKRPCRRMATPATPTGALTAWVPRHGAHPPSPAGFREYVPWRDQPPPAGKRGMWCIGSRGTVESPTGPVDPTLVDPSRDDTTTVMNEFSENPYVSPAAPLEEEPAAPPIGLLRACFEATALVVSAFVIAWTALRCAEAAAEALFFQRGSLSIAGWTITDRERLLVCADALVVLTFGILAVMAQLWAERSSNEWDSKWNWQADVGSRLG
jgi:hypothetical protein